MGRALNVRVMAYNILNGAAGRETAIVEVIRTAGPDVVVVPEVVQPAVFEQIARMLDMQPFLAPGRPSRRKVGVLSRLPTIAWRSIHLSPYAPDCLELKVKVADTQPFTVYGVHLIAFYPWFFEWWRGREIVRLLSELRRRVPGAHILAGDFNAIAPGDPAVFAAAPLAVKAQLWFQLGQVPRRALRPILSSGYVDCFRTVHPHADGFTLPATRPAVRLDYIFASPVAGASLRDCRVVTTPDSVHTASDHLPVLADFEWTS